MPRLEVQSFLDFAPYYFTYITGAVQQKVAKIRFNFELVSSSINDLQNNVVCVLGWPQISVFWRQGLIFDWPFWLNIYSIMYFCTLLITLFPLPVLSGLQHLRRFWVFTVLATRTLRTTPRRSLTCLWWRTSFMDARWRRCVRLHADWATWVLRPVLPNSFRGFYVTICHVRAL